MGILRSSCLICSFSGQAHNRSVARLTGLPATSLPLMRGSQERNVPSGELAPFFPLCAALPIRGVPPVLILITLAILGSVVAPLEIWIAAVYMYSHIPLDKLLY